MTTVCDLTDTQAEFLQSVLDLFQEGERNYYEWADDERDGLAAIVSFHWHEPAALAERIANECDLPYSEVLALL